MQTKTWYKSWTVWFNVGMFGVATMNELAKIVPIPATVMLDITLLGNFLLRFKTFMGVTFGE